MIFSTFNSTEIFSKIFFKQIYGSDGKINTLCKFPKCIIKKYMMSIIIILIIRKINENMLLKANLRDTAALVPDHRNRVSVAIKRVVVFLLVEGLAFI